MKLTQILPALITSALLTLNLQAEDLPSKIDLVDAVRLALVHNPGLKEIHARMAEQEGVLQELYSARRPKLSLEGNGSELDQGRLQSFGDFSPDSTSWDATAEASITVFSGGQSLQVLAAAREVAASLEQKQIAREQQLTADVHQAFYDAQLASEKILVQEQVIDVLKQQLEFTQNRLAAGVGEPFDAIQAEVALANEGPPLIRAKNAYRRNIDRLRTLIGLSYAQDQDAADIQLQASDELPDLDLEIDEALSSAEMQRPEIRELDRLSQAAKHMAERARRNDSPIVDLFADYGIESDQFGDTDYLNGWKAGLRFNWTFLDSGKTEGLVKQAEAKHAQLVHQRAALLLEIEGEIRRAFYDYEEAQAILASTGQVTEQAEEALRLARNRYQAGKGTQLDVLESQLQLTESLLEDITALNSLQQASIRIKRAAGIDL